MRIAIDLMRPTPHNIFLGLTIVLVVLTTLLVLAQGLSLSETNRIVVVTLTVFSGAAMFLIAAVATRFAMRVAADSTDDEMTREFLQLMQEGGWAPIRNGIVMTVGSATAMIATVVLNRWRFVLRA